MELWTDPSVPYKNTKGLFVKPEKNTPLLIYDQSINYHGKPLCWPMTRPPFSERHSTDAQLITNIHAALIGVSRISLMQMRITRWCGQSKTLRCPK
jgi:hypothetical protein